MKTGRLLKFHRGATEIHAYLYRDGAVHKAAIYLISSGEGRRNSPLHSLSAPTEQEAEAAAREWIESRYPRT